MCTPSPAARHRDINKDKMRCPRSSILLTTPLPSLQTDGGPVSMKAKSYLDKRTELLPGMRTSLFVTDG